MRGVTALALASFALSSGCSRSPSGFSTDNARTHLVQLAGVIGSRPAGTTANARARVYLADALTRAGFTVRIQTADASNTPLGVSGRVHNIIGVKDGVRREAIGLAAHYDSVAEGAGAADDGMGSAVVVEAARVLADMRDRQWTVMVLLTDAEELGLLGASAIVEDPDVRGRLKVVINIEAMGADAPVRLFETGPGNGWLAGVWASAAPRPRGASFDFEIYRRMPNDTDFSVFKRAGIPGLNLAAVGDTYGYHTAIDVPERVTARALEDAGATVVAVATQLQRDDITRRTGQQATYFDLLGMTAVAWSPATDVVLLVLALALGLVAWVRVVAACWRAAGLRGLLIVILWTIVGPLVVAGASIGSVALLRTVREVYHPWYARPGRFALMSVLAGAAAAWLLYRLAAHLPARIRLPRDGAFVWAPTLIFWTALAALMGWAAPRAAYLWVLPLAGGGRAAGGWRRRARSGGACVGPRAGHRVGVVDSRRRRRCLAFSSRCSARSLSSRPCGRCRRLLLLAAADPRAADVGLAGGQRVAAPALCHTGPACRHGVVDGLGLSRASLHARPAAAHGAARGGRRRGPAHVDRAGGGRQRTGPRSGPGRPRC